MAGQKGTGDDIAKYDPNMRVQTAPTLQYQWHSPKDAPMVLAGLAWFARDRLLRRMPVSPRHKLPQAVYDLANHPAGAQIRFRSNTRLLAVHVKLAGLADRATMTATGQCGFDLYIGHAGEARFIDATRYDHKLLEYEHLLFERMRLEPRMFDFTLHFPLLQGVEDVQVGLEPGAKVEKPAAFAIDRPVVIYGTSITHGACASRPGNCYTNILSRRLNVEVINLGFGGNGKGEPEVAHTIAEIPNPACLVVDYEGNVHTLERMQATLPTFLNILRQAHRDVPIVVVSKVPFSQESYNEGPRAARMAMRDYEKSVVDSLRAAGDGHTHFLDMGALLDPAYADGTVDGVHPNDLGFNLMADVFEPCLRKLLFGV